MAGGEASTCAVGLELFEAYVERVASKILKQGLVIAYALSTSSKPGATSPWTIDLSAFFPNIRSLLAFEAPSWHCIMGD
jgi:hypothetical protein